MLDIYVRKHVGLMALLNRRKAVQWMRLVEDRDPRELWQRPSKKVSCNFLISNYSKTCLKRNAIVPVFFSRFQRFLFYKGLCFNKTKYKKYDRLGLQ
jgi:hypothetical protein